MGRKKKLVFKILLFCVVFYALCLGVAAILHDDGTSYARVLMHELYEQDSIDILYCGASHVSRGIMPAIADATTGMHNFNTGTSAQSIKGTYAILRQAVKLYDIKKVFLEMDFAVATQPAKEQQTGFKADYLVAQYIRDPFIVFSFLTSISTPRYYINHFLPIGKDKYMTLQPKALAHRFKSMLSGAYFAYAYTEDGVEYGGKGCLLDLRSVKAGSFTDTRIENPIAVAQIPEDWKNTVDAIIALCKKHAIELVFYSMPCSDFYLHEKGNYDEYYTFCKNFAAERNIPYYDFNLAKESFVTFDDEDFHDDNHFSKQGVIKWTKAFWDCFGGSQAKESLFYDSYAEKIAMQPDKIYGLVLHTADDKKTMTIIPVVNHVASERIAYDISIKTEGAEKNVSGGGYNFSIAFPPGHSGIIHVSSYLDGVLQNDCQTHFTAF